MIKKMIFDADGYSVRASYSSHDETILRTAEKIRSEGQDLDKIISEGEAVKGRLQEVAESLKTLGERIASCRGQQDVAEKLAGNMQRLESMMESDREAEEMLEALNVKIKAGEIVGADAHDRLRELTERVETFKKISETKASVEEMLSRAKAEIEKIPEYEQEAKALLEERDILSKKVSLGIRAAGSKKILEEADALVLKADFYDVPDARQYFKDGDSIRPVTEEEYRSRYLDPVEARRLEMPKVGDSLDAIMKYFEKRDLSDEPDLQAIVTQWRKTKNKFPKRGQV